MKHRLLCFHELVAVCVDVAFTPKGGCPLKPIRSPMCAGTDNLCSIHPQGWVPIETQNGIRLSLMEVNNVAFTPKGGCPLKRSGSFSPRLHVG